MLLEECMISWMLNIEKSHYLLVLSGRLLNGCGTGQSKITRGYDLPAFVLGLAHFCDIDPFSLDDTSYTLLDPFLRARTRKKSWRKLNSLRQLTGQV
jgi:hypothetical protein